MDKATASFLSFFIGFGLVIYGFFMVYVPLGVVVCGAILISVSVALAKPRSE